VKRQADSAFATNVFEAILRMPAAVLPQTALILVLWAFVLDD